MVDQHYSDLQVDHDSQQPKYLSTGAHKVNAHMSSAPTYSDKIGLEEQLQPESGEPHSQRRICSLSVKAFYVVAAIIAVIVIAAAIGGGVGGALAKKSHDTIAANVTAGAGSEPSTAPSNISIPLHTTTYSGTLISTSNISIPLHTTTYSGTLISTSTIIGPQETLLSDCPSSNNTLYSPQSSSEVWRKICSGSYLNSNGVQAVVNTAGITSLNDCIALGAAYNLANATNIADGSSSICNAVCWRATITGDDFPGNCFGFTTTNSSGNFVTTDDLRCNSAALINQSFKI
jgi:hypothetical protein